jgi:lytic cellulose monooxygenase (C1-hydroxylating)
MYTKTLTTLATAAFIPQAIAHGYIRTWTLDGVDFNGYSRQDGQPTSDAIGWTFTTNDEGPEMDLSSPNFACRSGAQPAQNAGQIAAGGSVGIFWTSDDKNINPDGWAESHRGPIMTYIAPCGGDCSSVDATSLKWTKIAEAGVISGSANTQGTWATDAMRANGGVAQATIPSSIAAGNYVLRNEIIALHKAHEYEPEFYPQCATIEVTGSGSDDLSNSGVVASQLYSTSDSQIFGFSVYDNRESNWVVPGPPLYSGAGSASSGGSNSTGSVGGSTGTSTGSSPAPSSGSSDGSSSDYGSSAPVSPPSGDASTDGYDSSSEGAAAPAAPSAPAAPAGNGNGRGYGGWRPRGGRSYN